MMILLPLFFYYVCIQATLYGEPFLPLGKHGQGTEVKAITYSGMKVEQDDTSQEFNAYIVLDI